MGSIEARAKLEQDLLSIVEALDGRCEVYHNSTPEQVENYLIVAQTADRINATYDQLAVVKFGQMCFDCSYRISYVYGDFKLFLNVVNTQFYSYARDKWEGTWSCIGGAECD